MPDTSPDAAAHPILWSGMTHRGHVRPNNEDSFLALAFDARDVRLLGKIGESELGSADFVFAVSDGMGGAHSGEFASRIAVDRITRLLPRSFNQRAQGLSAGFDDILATLFEGIHHELIKLGQSYEECSGMGATLSLIWISPGLVRFAHIGDSRIYYLPAGGALRQVSHDHSFIGWQRRNGQLSEREARMHPRRNMLNQSLGAGNQFIDPHIGTIRYEKGDRILICSDGVTDGLWDAQISELLGAAPAEKPRAQCVVEAALSGSGRDNTTAVAVELP